MNVFIPVMIGIAAIAILTFIGFPIYLGYTHRHYAQELQTVTEVIQITKNTLRLGIGIILACVVVDIGVWFYVGYSKPTIYVISILIFNCIPLAWAGMIWYLGWIAHRRAQELKILENSKQINV